MSTRVPGSAELHVSVTRPIGPAPGNAVVNVYAVEGGRMATDPPGRMVFSIALSLFQAEELARQLERTVEMIRRDEDDEAEQAS